MTRVVLVLGMHRSGTSAITRGLKALGVELGDRLMPAVEGDNEKGFWEDVDLNALNVELLQYIGHEWHTLQPINLYEFERKDLESFRLRAVELLQKKMENTVVAFGIKDPRIPRLLPFWKGIFDHLRAETSYIITSRHPMSIARSLKIRDGFEDEKSHYLWLGHIVACILGSENSPRLVVSYDLLMDRPEEQLRRIATVLKLPFDTSEATVKEYTQDFLEERLRHTRFQFEDLKLDPVVPKDVIEAYAILEKLARDEMSIDSSKVHDLFDGLEKRLQEISPALRYMTSLEGKVASFDEAVAARDQRISGLNRAVAERDTGLMERDNRIASLNESVTEIEVVVQTQRDALTIKDQQIVQLQTAIQEQQQELAENKHQLERISGERDEFARGVAQLRASVQQHRMTLDMIHGSLGWLVTSKFRRLKDKYLLPGSRRRELYDGLLAKIKNRLRNGPLDV